MKGVASSALSFMIRIRPFCWLTKSRPSSKELRSLGAVKPLATSCSSTRTGPLRMRGRSGVGEGLGLGEGVALGEGLALGDGLGLGEAEGLAEGDGEGLGDGEGEGLGEGVGEGEPATTFTVPTIPQQPP